MAVAASNELSGSAPAQRRLFPNWALTFAVLSYLFYLTEWSVAVSCTSGVDFHDTIRQSRTTYYIPSDTHQGSYYRGVLRKCNVTKLGGKETLVPSRQSQNVTHTHLYNMHDCVMSHVITCLHLTTHKLTIKTKDHCQIPKRQQYMTGVGIWINFCVHPFIYFVLIPSFKVN